MTLAAGSRIGAYSIVGTIGAGGMGEVYRARDAKLNRDVAIKVLPAAFAQDPERLARFEREAQTLASLNHPNIAQVYGFEESIDRDQRIVAIVMELVEGEDLAARLARGPMTIDDARRTAREVAQALEAAHERGIVHRDLKPANIRIGSSGQSKVLDFGLAKPIDPSAANVAGSAALMNSPTFTSPPTEVGVILGTAAYMAPEQATGKAVDKRADIWAFGCLLFEMLAGRRAFSGETTSEALASVLKDDPNWSLLPADTPPAWRRLLRKCLQRDPNLRLHDIADARLELDEIVEPSAIPIARAPQRRIFPLAALFAAGAIVAAIATWTMMRPRAPERATPMRFGLNLPISIDPAQSLALSPDGKRVVFRGRRDDGAEMLFVRDLDALDPHPIPGTDDGRLPFFSPDGQEIAFYARNALWRTSLSSGEPRRIVDTAAVGTGGAWADDGTIYFIADQSRSIQRVAAIGGAPAMVVDGKEHATATPWPLPDGRGLLFVSRRGTRAEVAVLSARDSSIKTLADAAWTPAWLPAPPDRRSGAKPIDGYVVYQRGESLMALPFNLDRLEPAGDAFVVLAGMAPRIAPTVRMFAASKDGTLVYMPGATSPDAKWTLSWLDRNGKETPITELSEAIDTPRISPDGARIAFRKPGFNCDIWTYDLARGATSRVTFEGDNHGVVWTRDSQRIVTVRTGQTASLISVASDGSGSVQELSAIDGAAWPTSLRDDALLASIGPDVTLVTPSSKDQKPLLHSSFYEAQAAFSPEGRHVAYLSDQSGRPEVYVQGYPALGQLQQVSANGGGEPVWARNGRELFFRWGTQMFSVPFDPAHGTAGRPRILFSSDHTRGVGSPAFDVSADGQRIVMVKSPAAGTHDRVAVLLNWFATWK
jgi:serine/threonine-protein kinase